MTTFLGLKSIPGLDLLPEIFSDTARRTHPHLLVRVADMQLRGTLRIRIRPEDQALFFAFAEPPQVKLESQLQAVSKLFRFDVSVNSLPLVPALIEGQVVEALGESLVWPRFMPIDLWQPSAQVAGEKALAEPLGGSMRLCIVRRPPLCGPALRPRRAPAAAVAALVFFCSQDTGQLSTARLPARARPFSGGGSRGRICGEGVQLRHLARLHAGADGAGAALHPPGAGSGLLGSCRRRKAKGRGGARAGAGLASRRCGG